MNRHEAQRLVRSLGLPAGVAEIAEDIRFRDPVVIEALCDRAEGLLVSAPLDAVGVAEAAVALARTVAVEPTLLARVRTRQASAYRASGRPKEAAAIYRSLLSGATELPRKQVAEILRRYAMALLYMSAPDRALSVAEQALEIHRELQDGFGLALVIRGEIQLVRGAFAAAAEDFSAALQVLSPGEEKRHFLSAMAGLATCAARSSNDTEVGTLLVQVRKARRSTGLPPASATVLKLLWVEGLLLRRRGSPRAAEKNLRKARIGLLDLGLAREVALLTLDLIDLLLEANRWPEACELIAEATGLDANQHVTPPAARTYPTRSRRTGGLRRKADRPPGKSAPRSFAPREFPTAAAGIKTAKSTTDQAGRPKGPASKSLCLRLRLDRERWQFLSDQRRAQTALAKAAGREETPDPAAQALKAITGALRLRLEPAVFEQPRRILLVVRLSAEQATAVRAQAERLGLSAAETAARLVAAHCRFMGRLLGSPRRGA